MTPPKVEYREIPLTKGQIAYVSPRWFPALSMVRWYALWDPKNKRYYACRNIRLSSGVHTISYMHREILRLAIGDPRQADHKNRQETLNNTDENLRIVDISQQRMNRGAGRNNTSGFKGVSFSKATGKWRSAIGLRGTRICLGHFNTKEEAYAAYCEAARRLFGEFACII
jgi:hypothetical protein